jgi:hypothetical protein
MELSEKLKNLLEEFILSFNTYKVDYIAVGGVAVNHHGYSRASNDIDFWYKPTIENFEKIILAVNKLGYDTHDLSALVFDSEKTILRLPLAYFKVELIPILYEGIKSDESRKDFNKSLTRCEENHIGKGSFKVLGFEDLIYYKERSGRPKDLLDILELRNIRKNRPNDSKR